MRFSCYDWQPKRYHPEFNGIASRYSCVKQERLSQQKRRKELESDHSYTINLDQSLDKTLEVKAYELYKLQQARQRHLDQIKMKEQLDQERRRQIETLRNRNNQNRNNTKRNLEMARRNLINRNQQSRIRLNQNLQSLTEQMEKIQGKRHLQNSLKCKMVKDEQDQGQSRVNDFHRSKNEQSLQQYIQRIEQENKKKKEEQKRIKIYEKQIKHINKTVEIKKKCLERVEEEIQKLKTGIRPVSTSQNTRRRAAKLTEDSQNTESIRQWKKKITIADHDANPENSQELP